MTPHSALEIVPSKAVLINEASVVTGVSVRKINRLIDDSVLPKSVFVKIGERRALRAFAVPMLTFAASDGEKLSKGVRLEVMRLIEKFAKENWTTLWDNPAHAKLLKFVSGSVVISLGEPVISAMAGLNKLATALDRIEEDPDVRGGIPVIKGTRIGVYELADALSQDGMDAVLEDFPSLTRHDVEAASIYAVSHPRTGRPRKSITGRTLVSETSVDLKYDI